MSLEPPSSRAAPSPPLNALPFWTRAVHARGPLRIQSTESRSRRSARGGQLLRGHFRLVLRPSPSKREWSPNFLHFFFHLSLSPLSLCVSPLFPLAGREALGSEMARRLPPSSSSSLTLLSQLLARALDEVVAGAGGALKMRPRFFEGGWGDFFVDFSKDELVSSLSQFEEEKRLGFGAWLEDAERGPVLDVREREQREKEAKSDWAIDRKSDEVRRPTPTRKKKKTLPPNLKQKNSSSGPRSSPGTARASPTSSRRPRSRRPPSAPRSRARCPRLRASRARGC